MPPSQNVSAAAAAFIGRWYGYWQGGTPTLLIVQRIEPQGDASGIHVWGSGWGASPGYEQFSGRIENGALSFGEGIRFAFRLLAGGELDGTRSADGRTTTGIFTKVL